MLFGFFLLKSFSEEELKKEEELKELFISEHKLKDKKPSEDEVFKFFLLYGEKVLDLFEKKPETEKLENVKKGWLVFGKQQEIQGFDRFKWQIF